MGVSHPSRKAPSSLSCGDYLCKPSAGVRSHLRLSETLTAGGGGGLERWSSGQRTVPAAVAEGWVSVPSTHTAAHSHQRLLDPVGRTCMEIDMDHVLFWAFTCAINPPPPQKTEKV